MLKESKIKNYSKNRLLEIFLLKSHMKSHHNSTKTIISAKATVVCFSFEIKVNSKPKQGGRLALAYFSPNYKYFDQLLQTVRNKTTVLNLVFKEFLQTSIQPLISVLYAKGYHDFPLKNFCLTVPKNIVEEPFCLSESLESKNVRDKRGGKYHDFPSKFFVSQYRIIS